MKVRIQAIILLLMIMPLAASATTGVAAPVENQATVKIENMVKRLDAEIRQLRLLREQIESGEVAGVEALQYRQDGRSFALLATLDELVALVATMPDGDVKLEEIEQLLTMGIATIGETVFQRLAELEQHILDSKSALDSPSGGARISTDAYIYSLESIRFQYYDALINHFESRKNLGLSSTDLRKRLEEVLYIHAEKLAGQVEFSRSTRVELQGQFELDPANADLDSALKSLIARQKIYTSQLELSVELLERLGVENSEYRALLLKDAGSLSIGLFDSVVLKSLLSDWTESIREAAVAKSPDIILRLLMFIAILLVFRSLSRLTKRVVRRSCDSSSLDLSVLLKDILISWSGGAVMVLGIFMALSQVGISLGPMLAGLGVAGFVIGFALQDTLGNFASGAMILIYRPYDVDDFIEVAGASGLVKKMNLVSTTIVTFDNQTLVIPNSKIWGDVIKNVTAQKVRRVDLEFGIGYGDDIEHVERVLHDIVASHEFVLEKPDPLIKLHTLGDSSVNFIVRPWTKTEHYWDVYWDLMREVKMRFDREGISIPFPQRDVHFYPQADDAAQET